MKKIITMIMCGCACAAVATTEETLSQIEAATGWSVEELANGLAMLDRVYSNDCQTANGRVRWHGKVLRTECNTNTLTKTQIHEDGYRHTSRFLEAAPTSIDRKISAAEKKARREDAERKASERRARVKAARIAELQTNMTALATALANKEQYPLDLATMILQCELNKLVGTNVVNVTVTPQTGGAQ